jgi:hypothetical protein
MEVDGQLNRRLWGFVQAHKPARPEAIDHELGGFGAGLGARRRFALYPYHVRLRHEVS